MTTTTSAPVGISRIDLTTSDLDRSCAFYTEVLGLQLVVVLRQGEAPHRRHAVLQVGEGPSSLHVVEHPADAADAAARPRFGLLVADHDALQEVAGRLRAAGASDGEVRFQGPTSAVAFRDPDGLEGEVHAPNLDFAPSPSDACQVERSGEPAPQPAG